MRYLTITAGEPWAETWGVMLFPEDQLKRRAYIARLWAGFYPIDEEANLGESVPRPVLLSIMKAAAVDCIDKAEIYARYYDGMVSGEQLKVLIAIAQSQPARFLEHRGEAGRRVSCSGTELLPAERRRHAEHQGKAELPQ